MPVEIEGAIPFEQDRVHASYDAAAANAFWRQLVQADRVFNAFRARFLGKTSPSHFFWGSFDLAVTRFSGRTAPPLKSNNTPNVAAWAMNEAYSHECASVGFWPGNGGYGKAAFYAYAYPEPEGFSAAKVAPPGAAYNADVGQFLLDYDAVRMAASPDEALLDFMQSTYEAAANLGKWERKALERLTCLSALAFLFSLDRTDNFSDALEAKKPEREREPSERHCQRGLNRIEDAPKVAYVTCVIGQGIQSLRRREVG